MVAAEAVVVNGFDAEEKLYKKYILQISSGNTVSRDQWYENEPWPAKVVIWRQRYRS